MKTQIPSLTAGGAYETAAIYSSVSWFTNTT